MKAKILCVFLVLLSVLYSEEKYIKQGVMADQGASMTRASVFLPYNPTIIEIGAGKGKMTREFASRYECGNVICFEPDPDAYKALCETIREYDNVRCFPCAISTRTGKATLYKPQVTNLHNLPECVKYPSLFSTANQIASASKTQTENVKTYNLMDWCNKNNIKKAHVIYIDAAGSELNIVRSARPIIETAIAVFVKTYSMNFWNTHLNNMALLTLLKSYGFTYYSHWYQPKKDGRALFIKDAYYKGVYERRFI